MKNIENSIVRTTIKLLFIHIQNECKICCNNIYCYTSWCTHSICIWFMYVKNYSPGHKITQLSEYGGGGNNDIYEFTVVGYTHNNCRKSQNYEPYGVYKKDENNIKPCIMQTNYYCHSLTYLENNYPAGSTWSVYANNNAGSTDCPTVSYSNQRAETGFWFGIWFLIICCFWLIVLCRYLYKKLSLIK